MIINKIQVNSPANFNKTSFKYSDKKSNIKIDISFLGKTVHNNAEIERFKLIEEQAKKVRSSLPISFQTIYPLANYPKIKSKEINEINSHILTDEVINNDEDIWKYTADLLKNKNLQAGKILSQKEDEVFINIKNGNIKENNVFFSFINNSFSGVPEVLNLSIKEKADLLKTLKSLNIDGAILKKQLLPDFVELVNHAKNNKNALTEPVQLIMDDNEIEKYFSDNSLKILKALMLIGKDSLKLRLTQRLNKFENTINSANNIIAIPGINTNVLNICKNQGKQNMFEVIKFVELIDGMVDLNTDNSIIISYIKQSKNNSNVNIELLSKNYIKELSKKYMIDANADSWNYDYVYTIPKFLTKSGEWYKAGLLKLISLPDKNAYTDYIHSSVNSFGVANNKTKISFVRNNLDYDEWMNNPDTINIDFYNRRLGEKKDKTIYKSAINPLEKLTFKIWDRNPKQDLFQGSSAIQCIALDGINKNAGVDELLYSYAQLIELYNNTQNKSVGNACVYWVKTADNQKALIIDSVSVNQDYKNDFPLRNALFKYAKAFAKKVANEDIPVYIGNKFNKFNLDDLPAPELKQCRIIGDTNGKKVYLDAIIAEDTASRYVTVSDDKQFDMELRRIR